MIKRCTKIPEFGRYGIRSIRSGADTGRQRDTERHRTVHLPYCIYHQPLRYMTHSGLQNASGTPENGMCRYFIGNGTCPCILTGGRFGYGVVVRLHTDRDSLSGETHLPGPTVAVEKSRGFVRIRFPAAGGRRLRQPGRTFIGRSFSGPVFLHRISLPGWLRQSGRPGTV